VLLVPEAARQLTGSPSRIVTGGENLAEEARAVD